MKIIYCTHSTCNPGGMERVLCNKVRYLVEELGWDVSVVTTDQKGRKPFYDFPAGVKMADLGINYSDDNCKNVFLKISGYLAKRRRHKALLTRLLYAEKADIVVSLYPSESSFIPDIKDGSKKVLELHYCKFFRLQYGRSGLLGLIDRWRTKQDERIVSRFDQFVVLTNEDRGYWGNIPNICVIPNAALNVGTRFSDVSNKRVLAVGRLDYQKGFDRLIDAWNIVAKNRELADWTLDIFGQGEWYGKLHDMIDSYGLQERVRINKPVKDILSEYVNSSLLVMSSNYEGFPMVMIEAMACGLPVVAFDFKCGPKDIIDDGINGLIAESGNVADLAEKLVSIMSDESNRKFMSSNARKIIDRYSEETVMNKWVDLFNNLVTA